MRDIRVLGIDLIAVAYRDDVFVPSPRFLCH